MTVDQGSSGSMLSCCGRWIVKFFDIDRARAADGPRCDILHSQYSPIYSTSDTVLVIRDCAVGVVEGPVRSWQLSLC